MRRKEDIRKKLNFKRFPCALSSSVQFLPQNHTQCNLELSSDAFSLYAPVALIRKKIKQN